MTTQDWNNIVAEGLSSCICDIWVPVKNCVLGTRVRGIMRDLEEFFTTCMNSGFNPGQHVYLWPDTPKDMDLLITKSKELKAIGGHHPDQIMNINFQNPGLGHIKYKIIDGAHRITWLQNRERDTSDEEKSKWSTRMNHVKAFIINPTSGVDLIKLAHAINQVTHSNVPICACGDLQSMNQYLQVSGFHFTIHQ